MPTSPPADGWICPEKTRFPERRGLPPFNANPFESRGFREIAGGARRGDNPQYQLTKADYPSAPPFNGEIHSWTYDAIGNRLTNTVNSTTQTYAYLKNGQNPLNGQKLSNDGSSAYTYDFNGNTLTRTGYGFAYDAENRLTSITGNEAATYTYDYQGRRTSRTVGGVTTTYLYAGLDLIAETTAGVTSYFLNGPGIDEPLAMSKAGQISYFAVDGLGSVVATNDVTGTVTHSVVFDAWGNTKSELGTRTHPFTYTGREVGEAGLLFYRARFYQPTVGRFTQEDPMGAQSSDYAYVDSAPIDFMDPHGLKKAKKGRSGPKAPTPGARSNYSIVVCKKEKRLEVRDGKSNEPVFKADVVCGCEGKQNTPTPEGSFKAGAWQKDKTNPKYSGKDGWNEDRWGNPYGPWFLPINGSGGCGIHGTRGWKWLGDTFIDNPFACSHGCVRMSNNNIEKLHELLKDPAGTSVTVRSSCDE